MATEKTSLLHNVIFKEQPKILTKECCLMVEIPITSSLLNNNGRPDKYSPLTLQQIIKYENDPFWRKLRIFLMVLFWILIITMLTGAIYVAIEHGRICKDVSATLVQPSLLPIFTTNAPFLSNLTTLRN